MDKFSLIAAARFTASHSDDWWEGLTDPQPAPTLGAQVTDTGLWFW